MVVKNHPLTAVELWRCEPCQPLYRMECNRLAALARREAKAQEKRDAYEKPMLTTFDALEVRVDPCIACFLRDFSPVALRTASTSRDSSGSPNPSTNPSTRSPSATRTLGSLCT